MWSTKQRDGDPETMCRFTTRKPVGLILSIRMVARFAEVLKAKIVVVAGGLVPQSITGSSELPIVWRATKNKAVVPKTERASVHSSRYGPGCSSG